MNVLFDMKKLLFYTFIHLITYTQSETRIYTYKHINISTYHVRIFKWGFRKGNRYMTFISAIFGYE